MEVVLFWEMLLVASVLASCLYREATINLSLPWETSTVKPGYNDIGLYGTSPVASDILWYELICHC
jgi:hypothetical protein